MIDKSTLNLLCPMHVVLDADGRIVQAGPTLQKLRPDLNLEGMAFLDLFCVDRPRAIASMDALLSAAGRKLHMRFREGLRTGIKALLTPDLKRGGAVLNLSFGISVIDAVRDYGLTSADFAATDLAVEMLYLVEAKSAAMQASRKLNERLQTARLAAEERAFTDNLTGLRNRRAMDLMLARLVAGTDPFAVMHVDLDFFKGVNDSLGHAAGDQVLQHVSRQMLEATRPNDVVARVGGDEFVILLHGPADRARLAEIATGIIREAEKPIFYNGQMCRVSASVGIHALVPDGSQAAPDVLEKADIALYAAKDRGRGRFEFFEPFMRSSLGRPAVAVERRKFAGE